MKSIAEYILLLQKKAKALVMLRRRLEVRKLTKLMLGFFFQNTELQTEYDNQLKPRRATVFGSFFKKNKTPQIETQRPLYVLQKPD
jgi:hypothetical protein